MVAERYGAELSKRIDKTENDISILRERSHESVIMHSETESAIVSIDSNIKNVYNNQNQLAEKFDNLSLRISKVEGVTNDYQALKSNWKLIAGAMLFSALFGLSVQAEARELISFFARIAL